MRLMNSLSIQKKAQTSISRKTRLILFLGARSVKAARTKVRIMPTKVGNA
ncbi:MAG: hypothetical protein ACP5PX_01475 [Candidatus Hadarchaeum sp.]